MENNPVDFVSGMSTDGLLLALQAYKKSIAREESQTDAIARAILAYATSDIIRNYQNSRGGLPYTELPLELAYPEIHDRYIAQHERQRALTIITDNFKEVGWDGPVDSSEISLFMALIQGEIEGL